MLSSRGGIFETEFLPQDVQPFLCGTKLLLEFLPPGRVGKIPGAEQPDSLAAGPEIQMFGGAVPAGCAAVF